MQNIPKGKYKLINSSYVSIMDGGGCCCDNCGRVIANIVTVQHESGKRFIIGVDCAETILGKKEITTAKDGIRKAKKAGEMRVKEICNEVGKLYGKSCIFNEQDGKDLYNIAVRVFANHNTPLPKQYKQYA